MDTDKHLITKYNSTKYQDFKKIFFEYLLIFYDSLDNQQLDKLCKDIESLNDKEVVLIDLLLCEEELCGFIIYQIDSKESDWCYREGFGLIRELYIKKAYRAKGLSARLVNHAEKSLIEMSATKSYVTTGSETSRFWDKMGYKGNGEICSINDSYILIKGLIK